jgi:hypothetical protein
MNPSERIEALIEAGEKLGASALFLIGQSICYDGRFFGPEGEECGGAERVAEADDKYAEFFADSANAREAIRLAHEIAKAAGELRELESSPWPDDNNGQLQRDVAIDSVTEHLDALLAKYGEATND